jgi:hypothetical protein
LNISKIATAGALALAVLVARPAAVSADQLPVASAPTNMALPIAWTVGVFLCTGMTWGKMQVDAAKAHRELTGADAFRGLGQCLIPALGFAKLMQGK